MSSAPPSTLRVLIVDDNPLVCDSLSSSIPWATLNATVCATATSALQAERYLSELGPQILITDIRMPALDGLELTRIARATVPGIQVIVITAYDDFAYAQEALRLGAVDLLLKPLQDRNVIRAVRRAISAIEREEGASANNQLMQQRLERTLTEARRKLLIDLIRGYCAREEEARERALAVDYPLRRYQLLIALPPAGEPLDRDALANFSWSREETPPGGQSIEALGVIIDEFPVGVLDVSGLERERDRLDAFKAIQRGRTRTTESGSLRIAVSSPHANLTSMQKAYHEACLAAARLYVDHTATLGLHEELPPKTPFRHSEYLRRVNELRSALSGSPDAGQVDSPEAVSALVAPIFELIRSASPLGLTEVGNLIAELFDRCELPLADRSATRWPGTPGLPWPSLEDGHEAFVKTWLAGRASEGPSVSDPLVRRILQYLEEHYAEELRLSDLAHALELSTAYVSRLVRQHTGKTFTELLSEIRIERAKHLLQTTNAKVYQIADLVGLHNYAYFYQVFKKLTNRSPNDFR